MSMQRTLEYPSARSFATKWPPINPPPPQTTAVLLIFPAAPCANWRVSAWLYDMFCKGKHCQRYYELRLGRIKVCSLTGLFQGELIAGLNGVNGLTAFTHTSAPASRP